MEKYYITGVHRMNLNTLFTKQKQLDEHIVNEKGLHGQDLLKKKVVALICELYELSNELKFFKFWKEDIKINRDLALEEYSDVIHFALSIANDLGYTEHKYIRTEGTDLNDLVLGITNIATIIPQSRETHHISTLINNVIQLGYQLGFTEEDVLDAYDDKRKVNFDRQKSGY